MRVAQELPVQNGKFYAGVSMRGSASSLTSSQILILLVISLVFSLVFGK